MWKLSTWRDGKLVAFLERIDYRIHGNDSAAAVWLAGV